MDTTIKRQGKGISLLPIQVEGLKELAYIEGHLNISRVVQDLLDQELVRRFGPDWANRYSSKTENAVVLEAIAS